MTNGSDGNELVNLREELSMDSIGSRLKLLILAETPEKRRFPILEHATGIPENTWRTWWSKKGSAPSGALVSAAARNWPQFAFWLASGLTDIEFGHCIPKLHVAVQGYVSNYPEDNFIADRTLAGEYFRVCREIQDARKSDNKDANERIDILNNTRQFIMKKRRHEILEGKFFERITGQALGVKNL
ncbi:hypothetical protein [Undibacterium crateris]|uniref:hypothetical protein n=1 Tax=Undibacterium crateris TaxID=2528175 RepID=UPI001389E7F9|nr:hypothetical protein [Undibacterium crateris]NDI84621.1 hypothetical protein [Undibacterium crateris]